MTHVFRSRVFSDGRFNEGISRFEGYPVGSLWQTEHFPLNAQVVRADELCVLCRRFESQKHVQPSLGKDLPGGPAVSSIDTKETLQYTLAKIYSLRCSALGPTLLYVGLLVA